MNVGARALASHVLNCSTGWGWAFRFTSLPLHATSCHFMPCIYKRLHSSYFINNQAINQETAGPRRDNTCVVLVHMNRLTKRKDWIIIKAISVIFPKTILSRTTWRVNLNAFSWDIYADGWQVILLLVAIWWRSNKSHPRRFTEPL